MLSVPRGAALYIGALIGPGLLLVPALAADAAGPASVIAWGGLLALSAPLAVTFGALGVRHPVAGGVSAYVVITVLYVGLAVATIVTAATRDSRVPLADLMAVGFGSAGRHATAVLAIALTMGTMNIYTGAAAKLAAALAQERALPAWFGGDAERS